MTYRDEKGALVAKVDHLESELAAANAKIAALSGTASTPASIEGETLGPDTSLGVPGFVRLEKVLDYTLTPQGYEAIAALIDQRLGMKTTQVGSKLETLTTPRAPAGRVELSVKDGRTHLVLERDWSDRGAGTWVLSGMLAMFGGLVTAAVVHDVAHLSDAMAFAQILWSAPMVFGAAAPLLRRRGRRVVEAELAERRGTFAALVELAAEHRAGASVRARVDVAAEPEHDEPLEQELAARDASS